MIYWDYNATAPVRPLVKKRVIEALENYPGNPSSTHSSGQTARAYVERVRRLASEKLGVKAAELIFTASATESNLMSLWGCYFMDRKQNPLRKPKILSSPIEHSSMVKNVKFLEEMEKVQSVDLPLRDDGRLDLEKTEALLASREFFFCSLYAACNESGILFPWKELAQLCTKYGVHFHSDMVQLIGRESTSLAGVPLSSATFAFHKSGGLKGIGLLYINTSAAWMPVIHGGGQEKKRRSGTENLLGIASVEAIFEEMDSLTEVYQRQVREVRDAFEKQLAQEIPEAKVVGKNFPRLPNTSFVIFPGIPADELLISLDVNNICCSAGSACSSGMAIPSDTLIKLGFTEDEARSAIRFSMGESSTRDQIPTVIKAIQSTLKRKQQARAML